jgi:DNA-binding transcriptional ArsR family regulator
MEQVLQAIGSSYRRRILQLVRDRELSAGEVASHFPYVTRPAISQHLGILKEARLLHERRQGTRRLYKARPESLNELRAFLESFWDDHLSKLKLAAEAEQRRISFEVEERVAARKRSRRGSR